MRYLKKDVSSVKALIKNSIKYFDATYDDEDFKNFINLLYLEGLDDEIMKVHDKYKRKIKDAVYFNEMLSSLHARNGRFVKAHYFLERTRITNNNNLRSLDKMMTLCLDFRRDDDAMDVLKEFKKNHKDSEHLYNAVGSLLFSLRNLSDAKKNYIKAIEINKEYSIAYANLVKVLVGLRQFKEAEQIAEKASELDSLCIETVMLISNYYKSMNMEEKCLDFLTQSINKVDEFKFFLHVIVGDMHLSLGDKDNALISYMSAYRIIFSNKNEKLVKSLANKRVKK